jgi:hypothetical protein
VADLGIGAAFKAARAVFPAMTQLFKTIPAESIKRGIEKPSIIRPMAERAAVERQGVVALGRVQKSLETQRKMAGQAVENALNGLSARTKNQPVVDMGGVLRDMAEFAAKNDLDSEAVRAASGGLGPIEDIMNVLAKKPKLTAKEAVNLRRSVDALTDFSHGGMKAPVSEIQDRAAKQLRSSLNAAIDKAAASVGHKELANANARASSVFTVYDELRPLFATPNQGFKATTARLENLSNVFNKGGLPTQEMVKLEKTVPGMTQLLDSIASLRFIKLPEGTPSGVFKDVLRFLNAPRVVAASTKAAVKTAPAARVGGRTAATIMAEELRK